MSFYLASNDYMPPRLYTDFKEAKKRAVSLVKQRAKSGLEGGLSFYIYEIEPNTEELVSSKHYIGCIERGEGNKAIVMIQEYKEYQPESPIKNAKAV